jgi:hypothetical protein
MKPIGTPRDAIRPNGYFVEAIVNSATGSKRGLVEALSFFIMAVRAP